MIAGKNGRLPGPLSPEILELAKEQNIEFYDGVPQDAYPDALDSYRKEMDENGWDYGQDDEELFELAMHDRQYRDYKSSIAKKRFNDDLEKVKAEAAATGSAPKGGPNQKVLAYISDKYPNATPVLAPATGKVLWEADFSDRSMPPVPGKSYKAGDVLGVVQAYYGNEDIAVVADGQLVDTCVPQGNMVQKGDIVAWIA